MRVVAEMADEVIVMYAAQSIERGAVYKFLITWRTLIRWAFLSLGLRLRPNGEL